MPHSEHLAEPSPTTRSAGRSAPGAGGQRDETVSVLAGLLWEALRELGNAGEPVLANRIGGRAWSALRHRDAAAAQRINGLMHRLARQEAAAGGADQGSAGGG